MMRGTFSRRAVIAGLLASGASAAWAEAPLRSLRPLERPDGWDLRGLPQPGRIVEDANLGGAVSFVVADSDTGEILESQGAGAALPPASVAKAITATYALDRLGPEHRFATRVLATGSLENGVLSGDLVLAGAGDPTLISDHLANLAAQVKEAGIVEVRGGLRLWAGAFPEVRTIDPGQPVQVGYSPAVGGLNLNFNRVHFEWRRQGGSYGITLDARTETLRPDVSSSSMAIVDGAGPVFTYADGGGVDRWTVARSALGQNGARWLPVRNPAIYAGDVFRTLLRSQGILVPAGQVTEVLPDGREVAVHRSEVLAIILRDMLKFSTNITAEAVGLAATQVGTQVETLATSGAAMSGWARQTLGVEAAFVDHSGLGDRSRISAAAMVRALVSMGSNGPLRPILKDIVMINSNGDALREPPVAVQAKTGTLNFVSGLAGYATARDGRELSFAIFAADVERRAGLSREQRERPDGARSWNGRAKRMQQALLQRWGLAFPQA